jgi:hypothetical protein
MIKHMAGGTIRHTTHPHLQTILERKRQIQNLTAEGFTICQPSTKPQVTPVPLGVLPPPPPWLLLRTFFQRAAFRRIAW